MDWVALGERSQSRWASIAAAIVSATVVSVFAQTGSDLEVLQLRPNFYLIGGAGGNIAFQVGEDGIVVVDAGSAAAAT
jgi:hypothetical protein